MISIHHIKLHFSFNQMQIVSVNINPTFYIPMSLEEFHENY